MAIETNASHHSRESQGYPNGTIWSITGGDTDNLVTVKKKSKRTIVICSLIVVAVTSILAAWVFVAKPTFYPRIAVFSRQSEKSPTEVRTLASLDLPLPKAKSRKQRTRRSLEDPLISSDAEHVEQWQTLYRRRNRRAVVEEVKTKPLHVEEVTSVSDFPHSNRRLPSALIPMEYFIMLDVNLKKDNFTGEVEIKFRCRSATKHIIFHGRRLALHDVVVTPFSFEEEIQYTRILHFQSYEMFSIELEEPLEKNKVYQLAVKYTTAFSKGLSGFYKSTYKGEKGEGRTIASSHFEPTDARSAIPCFDEPMFKAKFHVNIVHDNEYHALSNMPVAKKNRYPGDRTQTLFKPSLAMSTYLLAFAVVDFRFKETKTPSGIRVRVYARSADYDRIDYACSTAATVISFYEGYFGVPYPLPKLDLLAVPDFLAGAMEDWGLVSFRSAYLIYDPKLVTIEMKKLVTLVIAHELAHQWFGNLVTMKWWNDIWLNEGFANFVEMLGTGVVNQKFHALDLQVPTGWQAALALDSLKNSHPISQPVTSSSEIDELFDSISYNKGAAVLRMLQSFLGNAFIEGVKTYINAHKFNNAETDDLWKALHKDFLRLGETEFGHRNSSPDLLGTTSIYCDCIAKAEGHLKIKNIMDTWTRQRGFPIISVERVPNKARLIIKQKSFLVAKDEVVSKRDQVQPERSLWHVPFTFVSSVSPRKAKLAWIRKVPRIEVPVEKNADWVKANVDSRGFYVVNYDNKTWGNLIKQLRKNHTVIPPVDRANLIHDALKLSCDFIINPLIALELLQYLRKEMHYTPWAMTRVKFDCITNLIRNKTIKKVYKDHLIDLSFTNPSLKKERDPVQMFQQYEAHSYALKYGLRSDLKKRLREIFLKYKKGEKVPNASAELRALTLTYGFNIKDDSDLDYIWNLYVNAEVDSDRRILMKTFSQFKDKKKLGKVLNNSLDLHKVRAQDTIPLLMSIVKIGGRAQVWSFIVDNFHVFRERYGGGYQLGTLLSEVAGGFMTRRDLERVKKFLATHSIGKKGSRTEKQIIEKIENNLKKHSSSKPNKVRSKMIEDWVLNQMRGYKDKNTKDDKNKDGKKNGGIWF